MIKKRSRGLTEAINDKKKRIIICTIQKFLFAYKDFDEMEGRKFAIIVDEAHQGQTGASAKTLRRALIDKKRKLQLKSMQRWKVSKKMKLMIRMNLLQKY